MNLLLLAPLAVAQAGMQPAEPAPPATEQDRLSACMAEARRDSSAAMVTASQWLAETRDVGRAYPQQCLGYAYVSLLRWEAAENAFLAARSALPESEQAGRARLAAMAGNAALAAQRHAAALTDFELAQADASATGDAELAGSTAADRARALVALERLDEAAAALADARRDTPFSSAVWLLSATLARRQEELDQARNFIEAAAAIAPDDAAIALEAGVIAALAGQDDAARKNWHSVIAVSPQSPEAKAAFYYLMQLDENRDQP